MKYRHHRTGLRLATGLLVGAAFLVACNGTPEPNAGEEELQTAVVRQGDLALFASGSGSLIPGREVELGFGANGPVAELNVRAGDLVETGEILAVAGEQEQLEAAAASAELSLLEAQEALNAIYKGADRTTAEAMLALGNALDALEDAQRTWQNQQEGYRASTTTVKAAEAELVVAQSKLDQEKANWETCHIYQVMIRNVRRLTKISQLQSSAIGARSPM